MIRRAFLALACAACAVPTAAALAAPPPGPGQVFDWGNNNAGKLGFDPAAGANSPTPFAVPGLIDATGVAGGGDHTIAVFQNGAVRTWGLNGVGQLGNGTTGTTPQPTPQSVSGIGGSVARAGCFPPLAATPCASAAAAGHSHTLALMADGTVRVWGTNASGQLGNASMVSNSPTPVTALGIGTATAIAAGRDHNLALLANRTLAAWGFNGCGALGTGNKDNSNAPVAVSNITSATAIAAGGCHSLARLADGTVRAWGNNGVGQLGDASQMERTAPVQVFGLLNAVALAAGASHSIALRADGTVMTWGNNDDGQLGLGMTGGLTTVPVQVPGLTGVAAIGASSRSSYALKSDGTLWSWGRDDEGELGVGTSGTAVPTPVQVTALGNGVVAVGNEPSGSLNGILSHAIAIARAIAALSPASLAFGEQAPGTTGPPQTVTVTNTGAPGLAISSVSITGADASDFTKTSDGCMGQTLAHDEICEIQVAFAPAATGVRSATLDVSDNAPASPQKVTLAGGTDPAGPGGPGGPGGPNGQPDGTAPNLEFASMIRRFAIDPKGPVEPPAAAQRRRAPKGTTFTYDVSEASRVIFTIHRARPGRRVRGKCRKPTRANRNRKRCTRYVLFGRFGNASIAGRNTKAWSGRLGRKKLAPGRYRATLVATDGAGNKSVPRQLRFTVVRR